MKLTPETKAAAGTTLFVLLVIGGMFGLTSALAAAFVIGVLLGLCAVVLGVVIAIWLVYTLLLAFFRGRE